MTIETLDNETISLNLYFCIIINILIILRQRVSSIFFKLSQLITFYSDKKPIGASQ